MSEKQIKHVTDAIDVSSLNSEDNFECVRNKFPEFYKKVHNLEGYVRVSVSDSQVRFRYVLDDFLNIVFKSQFHKVPEWNVNKKFLFLVQNKVLCALPMVDSKTNGAKFLYDFINNHRHSFKDLYVAMALLHRMVQKLLGEDLVPYSLVKVPVHQFQICQCRKCEKNEFDEEFLARSWQGEYAIIRHYKNAKITKEMFDESCFPKNFIRVENRYYKIEKANVICVEESQNTNFYVIYIFSNEEMHVDTVENVGWKEKDNFEFLKDTNVELYEKIHQAEMHARISYRLSSDDIRNTLEIYVANCIEKALLHVASLKYRRKVYISNKPVIKNREITLKNFDNTPLIDRIACALKNQLIPASFKVSYISVRDEVESTDVYKFLRTMGNITVHDKVIKKQDNDPKICRGNIDLALQSMYKILHSSDCNDFDVSHVPIGEYGIVQAAEPNDFSYSNCVQEYFALRYEDENRMYKKYAIVREYSVHDLDDDFYRELDTFHSIYCLNLDRTPLGISNVRTVKILDKENIDSRYIAYEFDRMPIPLSNEFLKGVKTKKDALQICFRITSILEKLHEHQIYHRMLTFDSIAFCDYEQYGMIPFLKNFNYSKLQKNTALHTVVQSWQKAHSRMQNNKYYYKYFMDCSECHVWDKVDIYCMGILFGDILSFEIQECKFKESTLKELGYSEDVVCLLRQMTGQNVTSRPSAADVKFVLKKAIHEL